MDRVAVADWLGARVLDPSCGSGSFLLAAIERKRRAACDAGMPNHKQVKMLTDTVWGFDLNPLAVLATRVNYLIAVADLLTPGQRVELPVLLADAIYSPARDPEEGEDVVHYRIGSASADLRISLPAPLAFDRARLDRLMEAMAESVAADREYTAGAKAIVRSAVLTAEEEERWRGPLEATYRGVLALHRKQWNGIWFRIVRNFFWSATAGKFNLIVGNPPWVRWSKLPELYRERVKPTCERYDIFSSTPHHGGNELDVSGIITYAAADKWLATGGTLAFVITQTHFQSPSSEGFRKFRISEADGFVPLGVDDMKAIQPFPGVGNKTAVVTFRKVTKEAPIYPVEYRVWTKRAGQRAAIPVTSSLADALGRIQPERMEAKPVRGSGSPWAILRPGRFAEVQKIIGDSSWVNGRKGIAADLNGVYFVEILDRNTRENLVQVATRPEAGKRNIGVSRKFWVEPDLLYPLIKGASDFSACRLRRRHDLFVFVPNRGIRQDQYDAAEAQMDRLPRTKKYFATYEAVLRQRSTYKGRQHNAPPYVIYNVGDYTFSPYKVIWAEQGDFAAAMVDSSAAAVSGRRPFVPDHKVFFADFASRPPALYLCGLLNSELVKEFVESHNISIQIGDIFKHMKLPEYDENNQTHIQLANAVEQAQAAPNDSHESHLSVVRRLGAEILSEL
jgi:hypothetical protein